MTQFGFRLWAALAIIVLIGGMLAAPVRADGPEMLQIVTASGTHDFHVEIAKDDASRAQGLMNRRFMPPDRGMLFEFEREEPVSFWMKNTYIPLDMIFISRVGGGDEHRGEGRTLVRARHSLGRPVPGCARTQRRRGRLDRTEGRRYGPPSLF